MVAARDGKLRSSVILKMRLKVKVSQDERCLKIPEERDGEAVNICKNGDEIGRRLKLCKDAGGEMERREAVDICGIEDGEG